MAESDLAQHDCARSVIGAFYDIHRFVVDHSLVIEVKATRVLQQQAYRQLRNYLRATSLELGLLLHFGPSPRVVRVYAPNRG